MSTAVVTDSQEREKPMGPSTDGSQFLTFLLGEEYYGVEILRVQEIKGYPSVTRIPNAPTHINGVINLRGTIVPIIDLRAKFSMERVAYNAMTVVVVVVIRTRVMGLVVDAVSDVLTLAPQDIQPPPQFGIAVDTSFITGIGQSGEKLITLLCLDRVLSDGTADEAASAAGR